MLVIVVYDISDNKRRTKLANFLEGYGRRVQYSVFECFLSYPQVEVLYEKVQKRVKPEEDNVRFYWISKSCAAKTLTIGSDIPEPPPNHYVI